MSNREVWPWSTKCSRANANRGLPREHKGHCKHPLPITQELTLHMDITRWSKPNQIDYTLCTQRWRSSIQLAKKTRGADCDSDHELIIAKFRLKLKKVGETTRPFSSLSCLTLCDPTDCSMPGLPVHHQLPGLTQTHLH